MLHLWNIKYSPLSIPRLCYECTVQRCLAPIICVSIYYSYATSAIHRKVIRVIFNLPLSLHLLVFWIWSISLPWRIKECKKKIWAFCSKLFHLHVRNVDGCWRIWNLDNLTVFFLYFTFVDVIIFSFIVENSSLTA